MAEHDDIKALSEVVLKECEGYGLLLERADLLGLAARISEAVAAKARELDAARGGTLHPGEISDHLGDVKDRVHPKTAEELDRHMAAQGRAIAALEEQVRTLTADNVAIRARWDAVDAEAQRYAEDAAALRKQVETLTAERDEQARRAMNASTAIQGIESERDALRSRVTELEAESKARLALADMWKGKVASAESALATLRQEVEVLRGALAFVAVYELEDVKTPARALLDGLQHVANRALDKAKSLGATPAPEHPDTAKAARWEANAREFAARPCCPAHERNPLSILPCEGAYRDTVRAIRERAKTDARWQTIQYGLQAGATADLRHDATVALASMQRDLLGDSGPSGGGEATTTCIGGEWPGHTNRPAPRACGYCDDCCGHAGGECATPTTPPDVAASEPFANHLQREADARDRCRQGQHVPQGEAAGPGADLCMYCGTRVLHGPIPASEASPTPEEDWRTLANAINAAQQAAQTDEAVAYFAPAWAALARLKDEPRRAAEAMRERCAQVADDAASSTDNDEVREVAEGVAHDIRAVPLE